MQDFTLNNFSNKNQADTLIQEICQKDIIEINISYVSDFRSAKVLRELVDKICKTCGVNPKWRTRLVLIVDELNNNAIEYGSKKGENNSFVLILKKEGKKDFYIESYVSDTGNGSHSKKSNDMEEMRKIHENKDFSCHDSIRGRGLFLIISQLVDTLYFKDNNSGGLTVGIQKFLQENSEK